MQPAPPLRSSASSNASAPPRTAKPGKTFDHRGHVSEVAGQILDAGEGRRIGLPQPLDQAVRDRLRRHLRVVVQDDFQTRVTDALHDLAIGGVDAFIADVLVMERQRHH